MSFLWNLGPGLTAGGGTAGTFSQWGVDRENTVDAKTTMVFSSLSEDWQTQLSDFPIDGSAPALSGTRAYCATDTALDAVDMATGTIDWSYGLSFGTQAIYVSSTDEIWVGQAQDNPVVVVDSDGNKVEEFDRLTWPTHDPGSGTIVGTSQNNDDIRAYDVSTRNLQWTVSVDGTAKFPAVVDSTVFGPESGGSNSGARVHVIDISSGSSSIATPQGGQGGGFESVVGDPVNGNGIIATSSSSTGYLSAIDKNANVVWDTTVTDTRGHPALRDGTLYYVYRISSTSTDPSRVKAFDPSDGSEQFTGPKFGSGGPQGAIAAGTDHLAMELEESADVYVVNQSDGSLKTTYTLDASQLFNVTSVSVEAGGDLFTYDDDKLTRITES